MVYKLAKYLNGYKLCRGDDYADTVALITLADKEFEREAAAAAQS